MALGLNRSNPNTGGQSYRNGNPINTSTHKFGNTVNWSPSPAHFGNPEPSSGTEQNAVTLPHNFGNTIGVVAQIVQLSLNTTNQVTAIGRMGDPLVFSIGDTVMWSGFSGPCSFLNGTTTTLTQAMISSGHPTYVGIHPSSSFLDDFSGGTATLI